MTLQQPPAASAAASGYPLHAPIAPPPGPDKFLSALCSYTPARLLNPNLYTPTIKGLAKPLPVCTSSQQYCATYDSYLIAETHAAIASVLQNPEGTDRGICKPIMVDIIPHKQRADQGIVRVAAFQLQDVRSGDFIFLSERPSVKPWLIDSADDTVPICRPGLVTSGPTLNYNTKQWTDIQVSTKNTRLYNTSDNKQLYLNIVCSVSSYYRVHKAMMFTKRTSAIFQHVLKPTSKVPNPFCGVLHDNHEKQIAQIQGALNDSQRNAIRAAMHTLVVEYPAPVLIQGPPGTGKTKTILHLLAAVIKVYPTLPIVVLAPSNSAVRQIASAVFTGPAALPLRQQQLILLGNETTLATDDVLSAIFQPARAQRLEGIDLKYKLWVDKLQNVQTHDEEDMMEVQPNAIQVIKTVTLDLPMNCMSDIKSAEKALLLLDEWKDKKDNSLLVLAGQSATKCKVKVPAESKSLDGVQIVFSTLNGAMKPEVQKFMEGALVIIDEASQAVEAESSIVLCVNKLKSLILVGDEQQLSATVLNPNLNSPKIKYGTSLFERLRKAGTPAIMLDVQYRMHPSISEWPATRYYRSKLQDGVSGCMPSWQIQSYSNESSGRKSDSLFLPFSFIDVDGVENQGLQQQSWGNDIESVTISNIIQNLLSLAKRVDVDGRITVGVIAPYRRQIQLIVNQIMKIRGSRIVEVKSKTIQQINLVVGPAAMIIIDVASIDGFQGQERDIILFSATRANRRHSIGFMDCQKRLNVALTRAKHCLMIIASASTFAKAPGWSNLIQSAKKRNVYRPLGNRQDVMAGIVPVDDVPTKYYENRGDVLFQQLKYSDALKMFEHSKSIDKIIRCEAHILLSQLNHSAKDFAFWKIVKAAKLFARVGDDYIAAPTFEKAGSFKLAAQAFRRLGSTTTHNSMKHSHDMIRNLERIKYKEPGFVTEALTDGWVRRDRPFFSAVEGLKKYAESKQDHRLLRQCHGLLPNTSSTGSEDNDDDTLNEMMDELLLSSY